MGVPVVYDGVGKKTFDGSIECLKIRGMMVSFGNASGPLIRYYVKKDINAKRIIFYKTIYATLYIYKRRIDEAAKKVFEKIIWKKFKIKIFKKYSLKMLVQAHQDLEGRKILGPAVIIP